MRTAFLISMTLATLLFANACEKVTYPKETLRESIMKLCKEEYNIDIDVSIVGKTIAIYLPITGLFDLTLNLSENAQDKIQNTLLGASRATLSTDADIRFYCIITQDVRLPEIQLVIVKYVEDIKRAFYRDISRGEYFKRTLIDINENPQAKKEQAILNVFNKMSLEKEWQEKVMDDFFRSPPSSLEGIGYWGGRFYVKDITLKEFLAQQMASRVRMRFREKEELQKYGLKLITGQFVSEVKPHVFIVGFRAEGLLFIIDHTQRQSMEREIFANIFEEINDIVYGYKFKDFDLVKIIEENYNRKLVVSRDDIYLFRKKKLGLDAILSAIH